MKKLFLVVGLCLFASSASVAGMTTPGAADEPHHEMTCIIKMANTVPADKKWPIIMSPLPDDETGIGIYSDGIYRLETTVDQDFGILTVFRISDDAIISKMKVPRNSVQNQSANATLDLPQYNLLVTCAYLPNVPPVE